METPSKDDPSLRSSSSSNMPRLLDRRESSTQEIFQAPPGSPSHQAPTKVTLNELSWPPTQEELANYQPVLPSQLPRKYRRDASTRIFVNRDIRLDKISYYGFDMDYTLAIYNSPEYEELTYKLVVDRLLEIGYPKDLKVLKYDPTFTIRGLFLDKQLGNFLKVDNFGSISICIHGRNKYDKKKISETYPGLRVSPDDIGARYYLINTLFSVPEATLYTDLVMLFDRLKAEKVLDADISYSLIFNDLRTAMDHVHLAGAIKAETLANMAKYIRKEPRLALLLKAIRAAGCKSFLLTNSEWYYTEKVMVFLLDEQWRSYFDIVIVSANKPKFFEEGTTLREVDVKTGQLKLGSVKGFQPTSVYAGGGIVTFQKLAGIPNGDQVLYIGDHIFADIIRSKKTHGWRTLLVVPELLHEIQTWRNNVSLYHRLVNLEWIRAEVYRGLTAEATTPPDVTHLRKEIRATREKWNDVFNPHFGSLFRSGSKQSFFSMQVLRYADLYTSEYTNLLNYPLFYFFSATMGFAPHETEYRNQ